MSSWLGRLNLYALIRHYFSISRYLGEEDVYVES
jgi:hypothetical protein